MAKAETTARKQARTKPERNGANLGFEQKLWQAADKLRGSMDAAEYKHVVLGLIFLKYISDAFQERYDKLKTEPHANPEDRDEYAGENVFWVPKAARWPHIEGNAKQTTIGKLIDDAMLAIEKENPSLRGVLPKDYARESLDKHRLGELIDLIGTIGLGDKESRSKDILGRVYEYFLGQFAAAEGKKGGQFYTARCVVKLLVEMIEPYKGRVFDPCCGSGGMFVQSEKFVEAHGGRRTDLSIYGQESNPTTWRLCKMNLAIRGIEANIAWNSEGSFHNDAHKDLKADFILANPPFNDSDWGGERLREDLRWKYGVPPSGNANFAWVQHFIHHLSPNGVAGFVLANGSMSSNQSGEGEIRKAMIEADLVDCMIALPGQLFYTTPIPVCLWFVTRNKGNHKFRDRRKQTLFIDARKMGTLTDRVHRDLSEHEISQIAQTYHAWRGEKETSKYADVPGFCKSAATDEIASHEFILTPGRYVGAEEEEDDGEPFEHRMKRLTDTLAGQFTESLLLHEKIRGNLAEIGFVIEATDEGSLSLSEVDVERLLKDLILADVTASPEGTRPDDSTVFLLVARIRNVALHVYCSNGEHPFPHFHLRVNSEYEASYSINSCERIVGQIPANLERVVLKWARKNREKLLLSWNEAASGKRPSQIEIGT